MSLPSDNLSQPSVISSLPERSSRLWIIFREIIETIILALVIWVLINFAVARYVVSGSSMETTLHSGEFIIVNRMTYYITPPQRGDIIIFHPPTNLQESYVKRIIGLPGDTIVIENGQLYINAVPVDEPYLTPETELRLSDRYSQTIPDGMFFVMGDNRPNSDDSRKWGFLEDNMIVGKAWIIYWPPPEWGIVQHHAFPAIIPPPNIH